MRLRAFLMHPNDWLSSTKISLMTPAQEGAYIRLLCHAWNDPDCSLPDDDTQLAMLSRMGEGWLKGGSALVRSCFEPHPTKPGRLHNKRLTAERAKCNSWSEKSRLGGLKSAESRRSESKGGTKGGSTTVPTKGQPTGGNTLKPKSLNIKTPLPPSLNTPDFEAAWQRWQQHRREIGKKLTPTTAELQLQKLSAIGAQRAVAAINHSIRNGWQGLFEPKPEDLKRELQPVLTPEQKLQKADLEYLAGLLRAGNDNLAVKLPETHAVWAAYPELAKKYGKKNSGADTARAG